MRGHINAPAPSRQLEGGSTWCAEVSTADRSAREPEAEPLTAGLDCSFKRSDADPPHPHPHPLTQLHCRRMAERDTGRDRTTTTRPTLTALPCTAPDPPIQHRSRPALSCSSSPHLPLRRPLPSVCLPLLRPSASASPSSVCAPAPASASASASAWSSLTCDAASLPLHRPGAARGADHGQGKGSRSEWRG